MRALRIIAISVFIAAVFAVGFGAGLCVNVFMERGVPMIHGGGELALLLAIPAAIYAGYYIGYKKSKKKKTEE